MKSGIPFTLLALALAAGDLAHAANWPQWRGPNQDGSSPEKGLPEKFSKTEGVKWAADLPGLSASVPAVWGDSVFITAPIEAEKKLVGISIDAKTGKERWRKVLAEGYRWDGSSNLASPSPVTDGTHVYFFFATGDLSCFDFAGNEVWKRQIAKDYGNFATQWTYSSSPVLEGGKLYIQVLQRNESFVFQGTPKGVPGSPNDSYILAIDPATGKDIWRVVRPSNAEMETREAFSTPVFANDASGKRVMLISGGDCLTAHDPATGQELWRWGNWNPDRNKNLRLVPSPVAGNGIALVCAPKSRPAFGVKMSGSGNLSDSDLAWTSNPKQVTSDVSTPVFYDGKFYVLDSNHKTLSCVDPQSGNVLWTGQIESRTKVEASPVAADGKIYVTNFWGEVYVIKADPSKFEMISSADMGDGTKQQGNDHAIRNTIAIANGDLFIRTQDKLYCVGK